jgi:hypothetical protein
MAVLMGAIPKADARVVSFVTTEIYTNKSTKSKFAREKLRKFYVKKILKSKKDDTYTLKYELELLRDWYSKYVDPAMNDLGYTKELNKNDINSFARKWASILKWYKYDITAF